MNFLLYVHFLTETREFLKFSANHIIDFYRKSLPDFLPKSLFFQIFYLVLGLVTLYYIIRPLRVVTYPQGHLFSFFCHALSVRACLLFHHFWIFCQMSFQFQRKHILSCCQALLQSSPLK